MTKLRSSFARVGAMFRRRELDDRIDEELSFHIEKQTEENLHRGMSPSEARRQARIECGGVEQVKETHRDVRGWPFIETVLQDLQFAFRSYRRDPGLTATLLVTLALGIGVGTAVFSIVNAVLLKPMPYRDPDRVVMMWSYSGSLEMVRSSGRSMGADEFLERKRISRSFENMAAFSVYGGYIGGQDSEQLMRAFLVSEGFRETLGVEPVLGRWFAPEEYSQDSQVMILQHDAWRARFAADPDIIGKQIELSSGTRTVIGVMPPGFALYDRSIEFLAPLDRVQLLNQPRVFTVVARLRDGYSIAEAQTEADLITRQLGQQYPELQNEQRTCKLVAIAKDGTADLREALSVLFAAVALVMLIVCSNTANLLLGRASSRIREMAIRAAIGAGRPRMIRQLLTESLVLSLLGATAGIGLAHVIVGHFQAIVPDPRGWGRTLVQAEWIGIDATTLAFAVGVSLAAGLIFGIVPALHAARTDPTASLKNAGTAGAAGQSNARNALVVFETALAVLLVCGAGLLIRSFIALYQTGPGFQSDQRISLMVYLRNTHSAQQQLEFREMPNQVEAKRIERDAMGLRNRRLLDRVNALPGVRDVAITSQVMNNYDESIYIWGYRDGLAPDEPCEASFRYVSPNYFELMGIPLLEGRNFDDREQMGSKPLIASPQVLKNCFGGQPRIDAQVQFGGDRPIGSTHRIVGVVGDLRENGIDKEPLPLVYLPISQSRRSGYLLIVRAFSDPLALAPAIKKAVREIDSGDRPTRFGEIRTLENLVRDSAWRLNYSTMLLGGLAGLSLLLAAVGVYGVLSHAVRQRTREIGLRMALGAEQTQVQKMILWQVLQPVVLGVAIGVVGAVGATRFLGSLLFGVEPLDVPTFAGVVAVLIVSALLASYIPARRAASIDPMMALRHE